MKDIKTFLIGFLTCACMFLIMGHSDNADEYHTHDGDDIEVLTCFYSGGEVKCYNQDLDERLDELKFLINGKADEYHEHY